MFIDTSAIVAILAREPDATAFASRIEQNECCTSAVVVLEASMRLSSLLKLDPLVVEKRIEALLREARIKLLPIDGKMAMLAVKAFAEYGKGRGHPAQLNLGDCLSYACAKARDMPLLYKGKDFSHTDLG